jgi:hypothetical protein
MPHRTAHVAVRSARFRMSRPAARKEKTLPVCSRLSAFPLFVCLFACLFFVCLFACLVGSLRLLQTIAVGGRKQLVRAPPRGLPLQKLPALGGGTRPPRPWG